MLSGIHQLTLTIIGLHTWTYMFRLRCTNKHLPTRIHCLTYIYRVRPRLSLQQLQQALHPPKRQVAHGQQEEDLGPREALVLRKIRGSHVATSICLRLQSCNGGVAVAANELHLAAATFEPLLQVSHKHIKHEANTMLQH